MSFDGGPGFPMLGGVNEDSGERAERTILELLADREPGKTICPSEAAREIAGDESRDVMAVVRDAAGALVERGEIDVTQRGQVVDLARARGPIRLRLRR